MAKIVVFGHGPMRWESSTRLFALALRTWHFANTLAREGHEVLLSSIRGHALEGWPADKITRSRRGRVTVWSISEHICHEKPEWLSRRIAEHRPDCIVGVNRDPAAVAVNFAERLPFWADINGDPMAEAQVKASSVGGDWEIGEWYRKLVPVLLRADHFSTCSDAQKSALVGQLGMLGRLTAKNDGYDFVSAIGNSIDDEELESLGRIERRPRKPGEPFVLLWSGGYNTWTDPDVLFETLELAMAEAEHLRFVSTGGGIAGHHLDAYARFEERIRRSHFRDRFELAGWVQTAELPAYYAGAHAAILVDRPGYEGMLGARTRALDWLAAGLPIVCTRLSEISIELERRGVALTAPCDDPEALKDAIIALYDDPNDARERGIRGRMFAHAELRAGLQLAPVAEWAAAPARAPDGENRVALDWRPGTLASLRRQANLLRSHLREQGPRATIADVGRFALRRLRHRAERVAERWGVSDAPITELDAPTSDLPPAEAPRFAAFQWRERFESLASPPRISVLLLVGAETEPHVLDWTAEQLKNQYVADFEVLIAETSAPTEPMRWAISAVRDKLAAAGHAVEQCRANHGDPSRHRSLLTADAVLLLPAGTLLRPDAIAELGWALHEENADIVYADDQDVDETAIPMPARRKPDFSPELLLARAYFGPALLVRSALFELPEEHLGWPSAALAYDVALRASERASRIVHVPQVLSQTWTPQHSDEAHEVLRAQLVAKRQLEALREALWRRGLDADAVRGPRPGLMRVRFQAQSGRIVVLVPGGTEHSGARGVAALEKTLAGCDVEIVVVETARGERDVALDPLIGDAAVIVVVDPRVEVFHSEWLGALAEQAARDGVAGVSPKLLRPNGTTAWSGASETSASAPWIGDAVHEVSTLHPACFAARRSSLRGARLPFDLAERSTWLASLTAGRREAGERVLFTPFSFAYLHGESDLDALAAAEEPETIPGARARSGEPR